MKIPYAIAIAVLLRFTSYAADPSETVRIEKPVENKLVPLSISGFSGEVDDVVKFDLSIAGFRLTSEADAQYSLKGSNAGQVEGRLTDRLSNTAKLGKAYSGGT